MYWIYYLYSQATTTHLYGSRHQNSVESVTWYSTQTLLIPLNRADCNYWTQSFHKLICEWVTVTAKASQTQDRNPCLWFSRVFLFLSSIQCVISCSAWIPALLCTRVYTRVCAHAQDASRFLCSVSECTDPMYEPHIFSLCLLGCVEASVCQMGGLT